MSDISIQRQGIASIPAPTAGLKLGTTGRTAGGDAGAGDDSGERGTLTRKRLLRYGALIAGLILVTGVAAIWTSRGQASTLSHVEEIGEARRYMQDADMQHDAIRAGVFGSTMEAEIGSDGVEALKLELEESFTAMADDLAAVAELDLGGALGAHIDGAQGPVAAYADASREFVASVGATSDPAEAAAAYAAWAAQFEELKAEFEQITTDLSDASASAESDANSASSRAVLLIVLSVVAALGVFVVVWRKVLAAIARIRTMRDEREEANARERTQAAELQTKVSDMLTVIAAAAKGDLTRPVTVSGDDSVGQMGEALATLLGDLRSSISGIASNSEALAAAAEELQVVSVQMGANAAETSSQVNVITESSADVSRSVETVSTGAEEMSASIKEIARNASDAAKVASQAVEAATVTNETVSKLGESSAEIGEIVKVITGIAQQTNLLALNATIEAARAGEAGKGFAVVANEVKELAKETAKATEDISSKIEAIQSDTQRSVEAITGILGIINQIAEFQDTIASAVEQQAATTSEIARSVTDASRGSTEITANMQAVASAAESTSSGAGDSQRAASELAHMAAELQDLVGQFTY